jgi:peptidoglycan hydrolase-like protein with peptidoglycan-binding domain
VQSALNYQLRSPRVPLVVDGQFGPKTDARARDFQQVNKFTVDGIVGPKTRSKLLKHMGSHWEATLHLLNKRRF